MLIRLVRNFQPGDEVVCFSWSRKNQWSPEEIHTETGTVVATKDGWIYVDTCFGPVPYKPEDLEYADAPF